MDKKGRDDQSQMSVVADELRKRAAASLMHGHFLLALIALLLISTGVVLAMTGNLAQKDVAEAGFSTEKLEKEFTAVTLNDVVSCENTAIAIGDDGVIGASMESGFEWDNVARSSTEHLRDVAFSADCSRVVAVGDDGAILSSENSGASWTTRPEVTQNNINSVALSVDGKIGVAVGDDGLLLVSTDGSMTWRKSLGLGEEEAYDIALSADGQIAVVAGRNNLAKILKLKDGSFELLEEIADIRVVDRDRDRDREVDFQVAVIVDRPSSSRDVSTQSLRAFVFGQRGTIYSYTPESNRWIANSLYDRANSDIVDVAFHGDKFIAVGEHGTYWISVDGGSRWHTGSSGQGNDFRSVALNSSGTAAVAVGDDGTVLSFTDPNWPAGPDGLLRWTSHNVGFANRLFSVTSVSDNSFIAVGNDSMVLSTEATKIGTASRNNIIDNQVGYLTTVASVDEASDSTHESNEKASSWTINQAYLALVQNNLLRIGTVTLFMFIAANLFGLARYQFRLSAYYRARVDALHLADDGKASGLENIDQLERAMLVLSPDHLETSFSSTDPVNRMLQIAPSQITQQTGQKGSPVP